MSKFIKAAAAVAVIATSATGPAHAAALSTDVDVTLPSIIALYCYDKVDVNVTTAGYVAATGAIDGGSTTTSTGPTDATSPSAGNWEAAVAGLDTTAGGSAATDVDLTMTGVCAFRALATSTGVNVSIDRRAADGDINHPDGAKIVATAAKLVNSGAAVDDYDVTTGLGLGNVNPITVRLPLDLSAATLAGTYTTSDLFTVTVVANP